jgi:hypothetical protein
MNLQRELLSCFGTALATTAGLFALQAWYASYLDVAVVHGDRGDVPQNAKLEAVRREEQALLTSGRMPIDRAMQAIAERGRSASSQLAVQPSSDLSAMSGWIHRPGFRAYVPHQVAAAAAEVASPGEGDEAASAAANDPGPEERDER